MNAFTHPVISIGLAVAGPLLVGIILLLLVRRGLRRTYPHFFNFMVFQAASRLVLPVVLFSGSYATYFYAYWVSTAIDMGLGFLVIVEVFGDCFKPFDALRDFGHALLRWAALLLLIVAGVVALLPSPGSTHWLVVLVLTVERSVYVMQCGMLMMVLLFAGRLGLTGRHHAFGIALGLGSYAAVDLLLSSLLLKFGPGSNPVIGVIKAAAYDAMLVVWTVYLASPEPARLTLDALGRKPVLHRWNEQLVAIAQGGAAADTSFIGGVDRAVERVMEKSKINWDGER
jgi:hypothetical protein